MLKIKKVHSRQYHLYDNERIESLSVYLDERGGLIIGNRHGGINIPVSGIDTLVEVLTKLKAEVTSGRDRADK